MHLITWESLEEELKSLYSEPFARQKTWLKHRQVVRLMSRFAPSPSEFDVSALCSLAAHLSAHVSPATVNSLLVVVRCQLNYLDAQGYVARNPWRARKTWRVKICKGDPRTQVKKHQSIDEIAKLLARAEAEAADAADDVARWKALRLQSLIVFTVFTGCRAGESLHLRRDELELSRNLAWITETSHRTKTEASVRMVPVAPQAVGILRPWVESLPATTDFVFPCRTRNRPWLHGSTTDRPLGHVKALGDRAGIPGVTLLSLRHTFTTHARQMMGLSREQVQAILGHASPQTQDHYDEPDIDNVRRLAQQIRFTVFDPDRPAAPEIPNSKFQIPTPPDAKETA